MVLRAETGKHRRGLTILAVLWLLSGCGVQRDEIFVLSREDGSGTRSAFTQLVGVEIRDDSGRILDGTVDTAEITNSTGVMLSGVAENEQAIGYVSMGALNSCVKAVAVDGVTATVENVRSGRYPVSRELCLVLPTEASAAARNFLAYIFSREGAAVVEEAGYVSCGSQKTADEQGAAVGTVTVSGSSSVFPVMEKLAEAYQKVRPEIAVILQISDSTTGIRDAADGLCDLGMTSRTLTEAEKREVETVTVALDGIAVIVHPRNPVENLSRRQLCGIYTGSITAWGQLDSDEEGALWQE